MNTLNSFEKKKHTNNSLCINDMKDCNKINKFQANSNSKIKIYESTYYDEIKDTRTQVEKYSAKSLLAVIQESKNPWLTQQHLQNPLRVLSKN